VKAPGEPIVIFVPFMDAFAGVERLILGLSRFLHDQRLPHTVVCFAETIGFASYATWPVPLHQLTAARNPLAEGWALHRYLTAARSLDAPAPLLFDLKGAFYAGLFRLPGYHVHFTDPPSLLPADISKRAFSSRHAFRPQGTSSLTTRVRGEIAYRVTRRGVVKALSVIAMSDVIARELRSLYSVEPTIVRPGVTVPQRTARSPRKTDGFRALSVCRLEPNKRVDWILQAWGRLASAAPSSTMAADWTLDIVGGGSQRMPLEALAEELGIAANVVFHGTVSDERLDELFRTAHLFLMPAAQGYGLPALEALARGVPVVLHGESGVSEILHDTSWVHIMDDGVEELTRVMQTMMHRIRAGELLDAPMPAFPTETGWAREISTICGWI
jgi:glycosyltransferase involved in cell wall biosynthesis